MPQTWTTVNSGYIKRTEAIRAMNLWIFVSRKSCCWINQLNIRTRIWDFWIEIKLMNGTWRDPDGCKVSVTSSYIIIAGPVHDSWEPISHTIEIRNLVSLRIYWKMLVGNLCYEFHSWLSGNTKGILLGTQWRSIKFIVITVIFTYLPFWSSSPCSNTKSRITFVVAAAHRGEHCRCRCQSPHQLPSLTSTTPTIVHPCTYRKCRRKSHETLLRSRQRVVCLADGTPPQKGWTQELKTESLVFLSALRLFLNMSWPYLYDSIV